MELNGGFQISFPSLEALDILVSLCPFVADCRPPSKASNFSIDDCGTA